MTPSPPAPANSAPAAADTRRVLSGMRPTGKLHLGHYHGVLKNWVQLQREYECFYFVADWHALTTHYAQSADIQPHTWDMVIDWLAAGVDPEQATLFIQSQAPEHAELHLLLAMITPLGWLTRVPSFKEQQQNLRAADLSTYGFLGYPLLQAADILIYRAARVPVGEDQVPHVELTREIARRFNHIFARGVLPEPQALLTAAAKMPGLDGRKMSKSYGNAIALRDDPARVRQAIKVMPTDPARVRRSDPGDPDKCPVWKLHELYSAAETRAWAAEGCRKAAFGCTDCKQPLIESVLAEQTIFRDRARPFETQPRRVREIIAHGADQARQAARATMELVRAAVGTNYS